MAKAMEPQLESTRPVSGCSWNTVSSGMRRCCAIVLSGRNVSAPQNVSRLHVRPRVLVSGGHAQHAVARRLVAWAA